MTTDQVVALIVEFEDETAGQRNHARLITVSAKGFEWRKQPAEVDDYQHGFCLWYGSGYGLRFQDSHYTNSLYQKVTCIGPTVVLIIITADGRRGIVIRGNIGVVGRSAAARSAFIVIEGGWCKPDNRARLSAIQACGLRTNRSALPVAIAEESRSAAAPNATAGANEPGSVLLSNGTMRSSLSTMRLSLGPNSTSP